MLVTLDRLTVTSVDVDLPENCPRCGRDLREAGCLKEDQYIGSEQLGQLTDNGPECCDKYENAIQVSFIVGYRCGSCGEVLISTEDLEGGEADSVPADS